jgi:hypothetical protein
MKKFALQIEVPDEQEANYLRMNADIRGYTATRLLRKCLQIILKDRLILSILDDGDAPPPPKKRARIKYRKTRFNPSVQLRASRKNTPMPRSKSEIEADYMQAMRNTAELPVE